MASKETISAMMDAKEFVISADVRGDKDLISNDAPPSCSVPNCARPCKQPPSPPGCKVCRRS